MQDKIKICFAAAVLLAVIRGSCSSSYSMDKQNRKFSLKKSTERSDLSNSRESEVSYPGQTPTQPTRCRTIPRNFGLCYGMEYIRMRIPNLLGHETMNEVMQQSNPWPPLVAKNCHPETRKFLCSLFAPVCMRDYQHSIQPCRSLCESVQNACSPAMAKFGYPWPKMLNCSKFPSAKDGQLCIPESRVPAPNPAPGGEVNTLVPKTCTPCRQKKAYHSLRKKFCTFDFVMKVRIKRLTYNEGNTRIQIRSNKKRLFRWAKSIPKPRKLFLWMRDGLHCTCSVLSNNKNYYLVTGWKEDDKLTLHSITKWSKKCRKVVKRYKRKRCSPKS